MANDRVRWTVRRELLPTPGAWQRWDRAYQLLLAWTSSADQREEPQEEGHEGGDVRPSLDSVSGAGPDD